MTWITCDVDMSEVLTEATDEQVAEEYENRFGSDKVWDTIRDLMRSGDGPALMKFLKDELYERKGVIF